MSDLELRLSFLNLSETDLALLADLRPVLERSADGLVAAFYRHLLSYEPTRELLSDPQVKDRLLGKQRAYLISLCGPKLDEEYFRERFRIGVEAVFIAPKRIGRFLDVHPRFHQKVSRRG